MASAAWRDTYRGLLRSDTIESFLNDAYSETSLQRRVANHTFLVADDGGDIVGFADAIGRPDHVMLAAIYVLPDRRGEGIGTALLAEVQSRFPRQPIAADVLVGNRKGEVFYGRRGFIPREVIEVALADERVRERRWWHDLRADVDR